MRFLADENVSHCVVERLRAAGLELTAIGLTNPGASDSDVLATATRGAHPPDGGPRFRPTVVRQHLEVQGVILLEMDRLSNTAEADRMVSVVSTNVDKPSGNLLAIEPGRVRIRPLRR